MANTRQDLDAKYDAEAREFEIAFHDILALDNKKKRGTSLNDLIESTAIEVLQRVHFSYVDVMSALDVKYFSRDIYSLIALKWERHPDQDIPLFLFLLWTDCINDNSLNRYLNRLETHHLQINQTHLVNFMRDGVLYKDDPFQPTKQPYITLLHCLTPEMVKALYNSIFNDGSKLFTNTTIFFVMYDSFCVELIKRMPKIDFHQNINVLFLLARNQKILEFLKIQDPSIQETLHLNKPKISVTSYHWFNNWASSGLKQHVVESLPKVEQANHEHIVNYSSLNQYIPCTDVNNLILEYLGEEYLAGFLRSATAASEYEQKLQEIKTTEVEDDLVLIENLPSSDEQYAIVPKNSHQPLRFFDSKEPAQESKLDVSDSAIIEKGNVYFK